MADNIKSFITDELNTPDVKPVSVSKLYKSVMGLMNGTEAPRLAFERDPSKAYASDVYIAKERLLPDSVCKRLALKDSLVGTILQTRYTQLFPFGRPRPSRSEIGYTVQLKEFVSQEIAKLPSEQKQAKLDQYAKRIAAITKKLRTCGDPHAASDYMSFSQYVGTLARQGMTFGRVATEIITKPSFRDANEFSYFRPVDAGTIYKARPLSKATHEVRERAIQELNRVNGSNISGEKLLNDEYTWVQVIQDGSPKQAFTSKELVCHSFFPSLDFELEGYPVTPMDLAVSEIVSHIHLTDYNRLYFESGRSAKQILLIKSNDMDEKQVDKIRQAFQAQIIGNANSHRLPLFAVDENEDVTTVPLEGGAKDMEFQYLSDMTARIIFSAFMMAPDELAGWTYLSKGSSNQALCLDPKSEVYVENQGLKTLWSILDGKQESYFNVWTGKRWEKARVFETGVKASVRTKFRNGMSIDTSPDHRFLGVGPDGILDWIPQKDLKVGQFVAMPGKESPDEEETADNLDYRFESITEISDLGIEIPMVDVEVYDDTHAFVANGMIVHNSESNAEFKLTKITDMGIRPILANIEDYLNLHILPLFDPEIADDIVIKLCGLDAETPEKESIRIQQDQNLHCDYDEIRTKVDKPKIGKRWGGEYPFNPYWRQVADQFIPVGIQLEHFFGVEGASKDPKYDYLRDPFYFQQQQLLQQAQMMQAQEAAQSQQAPDAPDGPSGEDPSAQGDGGGDPQNLPKNRDPNAPTKGIESKTKDAEQQGELADNLTEAVDAVSKSLGILATTDREAFLAFAKSVRGLARKKG